MNDTPRTDEEAGYYDQSGCWKHYTNGECVTSDFARELERELNADNDRIKRLEEAGDALLWYFCPKDTGHISFPQSEAIRQWNKAKEAKP